MYRVSLVVCLFGWFDLFVCLCACELVMFVSLFVGVGHRTVAEPNNQTCNDTLEQQSVVYIYIIKWRLTAQNPILRYGTRSHDDYMSLDPSKIA